MALKLVGKQKIVSAVQDMVHAAQSAIVADYCGLTVSEIDVLRVRARAVGVRMRVVRNTLAKRAFEGTSYDCLTPVLSGPVMLVFSYGEPSTAAKLLVQFAKEYDRLEVKALSLGDGLLTADQLDAVAKLPTYEEAISQLLSVMQGPTQQLAGALHQTYARLVRVVNAVGDQKQ